jgi:hypothetical protein
MFVPCIIRHSKNNQHYSLICSTPLFYILAPTCFGSSLPLSGSFLDPSELPEIQIDWVVYHIMCSYVACVPDYRGSYGIYWLRNYQDLIFHCISYLIWSVKSTSFSSVCIIIIYLFYLALQPSAGYGLLVLRGFLITHNDAPQSVVLL